MEAFNAEISATAELILESKIRCRASGEVLVCAENSVNGTATARASYEAYLSARATADLSTHCSCGQELFADADATIEAWAGVWTTISDQLSSGKVCASGDPDDEYPARISVTTMRKCTSTVAASYWGQVVAKAWIDNDCRHDEATRCMACCIDDDGSELPDCDCAEWTANCQATITARTEAIARAWIDTDVRQETAECTTTVTERVHGVGKKVTITTTPADWVNSTGTNLSADVQCNATAIVTSEASAISAQAAAAREIVEETCNLRQDRKPLVDKMTAFAEATASVYTIAYAKCTDKEGGEENTTGCALSSSFGSAYAEACARATVDAIASIPRKTCDCDIETLVATTSFADRYTDMFALAESSVAAGACDAGITESEARTRCFTETFGTVFAQALVAASQRTGCVAPSAQWCEDSCELAEPGADRSGAAWAECIDACGTDGQGFASAYAAAVGEIEISSNGMCQDVGPPFGEFDKGWQLVDGGVVEPPLGK